MSSGIERCAGVGVLTESPNLALRSLLEPNRNYVWAGRLRGDIVLAREDA